MRCFLVVYLTNKQSKQCRVSLRQLVIRFRSCLQKQHTITTIPNTNALCREYLVRWANPVVELSIVRCCFLLDVYVLSFLLFSIVLSTWLRVLSWH